MAPEPRLALVIDALPVMGGAERLLAAVLEVFPQAPVYTLIYNPPAFAGTVFADHAIHTTFVDRLPWGRSKYRSYLPLLPLAIEQFDLRGFDKVVSFHYAVAHGVVTHPDQVHISYVNTPMRYAWQQYHPFVQRLGVWQWPARLLLHAFRQWDTIAASRVDRFAAVSQWARRCVWRAYHREAQVLYPPVEVERFRPAAERGAEYIVVSRLVAHKRVDVIVDAFSQMGLPLWVVGDGPERKRLARRAGANVRLLGWQPDAVVADLLGRARAFVHAAEEDFGIAMAEAQAAGCPVIAYGQGGASEIVLNGETGLFFSEQSSAGLVEAVQRFEACAGSFDPRRSQANAQRFAKDRFQREFISMVDFHQS